MLFGARARTTAALTAAIMLVVAACSSTAAPSVTFAPSASSSASAAASAPSPSAAASPSDSPAPSGPALDFTPGTAAAPRTIHIDTNDTLLFTPNAIKVATGETVTFEITNKGKVEHEFMIGPQKEAFGDEAPTEVAEITAGLTKTVDYTFKGPGPFAFACHATGHFEAGMLGYIELVGPDVASVGTKAVPRVVPITMSDTLKFDPATEAAAPGETVSFLLINGGTVTHEFLLGPEDLVAADKGNDTTAPEVADILGGHIAELTYTFAKTGAFAFACHATGHYEAGMKGTVTLQ